MNPSDTNLDLLGWRKLDLQRRFFTAPIHAQNKRRKGKIEDGPKIEDITNTLYPELPYPNLITEKNHASIRQGYLNLLLIHYFDKLMKLDYA